MAAQVRDLGEHNLLQRLYKFCSTDLVGDDAAVMAVAEGHCLVVTTDMLVDGVHFSDQTTTPADVGWRAAAANLSDLAAMGATPLGITVGLGLPGKLPVAWVETLYKGLVDCLQCYNTPIVGGDVCRSPVTTVSITAFGQVLPHQAIKRSNAEPGDVIWVTGVHGASRAGLELLLHPEQGQKLAEADRANLIRAHQRPKPRMDVVDRLRSIEITNQGLPNGDRELDEASPKTSSPSSSPWQIAGMDTSDGLADAVLQICRASQVGAQLERNQIPFPAGLVDWVSQEQAIEWALYGGEDFELVLCLPLAVAQKLMAQVEGSTIVGTITADTTVVLKDSTGQYPDEILSLDKGFQHF